MWHIPFNPSAILNQVSDDSSCNKNTSLKEHKYSENTEVAENFTEEKRFERWYTNGFDLHDPKYILWIKLNHLETVLSVYSTEATLVDISSDASPDAVTIWSSLSLIVLK